MISLILVVLLAIIHSQEAHTSNFNDAYQNYVNNLLVLPAFNANPKNNLVQMNAGYGGNDYGDLKPVQEPNAEPPPPNNMFGKPIMQVQMQNNENAQKPAGDTPQFAMLIGQQPKIPSATYGTPIPGSYHQIPQNGMLPSNIAMQNHNSFTSNQNQNNFIPPLQDQQFNHNNPSTLQDQHFNNHQPSHTQTSSAAEQNRVTELHNLNAQVMEAIKHFSEAPLKTQGSSNFYFASDPTKQFDFTLPSTVPHKIGVPSSGLGNFKTDSFESPKLTSEGLKNFNSLSEINLYNTKTPQFDESKFNIYNNFYNDKSPFSGGISLHSPPKEAFNFGKSSFPKSKFPITNFDSHGFNGKFNTDHGFAGGKGVPKLKKSPPKPKPTPKRVVKGKRYVIKITKRT